MMAFSWKCGSRSYRFVCHCGVAAALLIPRFLLNADVAAILKIEEIAGVDVLIAREGSELRRRAPTVTAPVGMRTSDASHSECRTPPGRHQVPN